MMLNLSRVARLRELALVALVLAMMTLQTACGVARVGNATIGEIGVGGSLTGSAGELRGQGAVVDDATGAELAGGMIWFRWPAIFAAGMRMVSDAVGGAPPAGAPVTATASGSAGGDGGS